MKKEYKARLQGQRTYLVETLEGEALFDQCMSSNAINFTDLERIRAERSVPARVEVFLDILENKDDDRCYEVFREALSHPSVDQAFIVPVLDNATLPDDVLEDCRQKAVIEQILRDKVVVKSDSKIPKAALKSLLRHQLRGHKQSLVVCDQDIVKLLSSVFPCIHSQKKRGKITNFVGIALKESGDDTVSASNPDGADVSYSPKYIPEERVAEVMSVHLEKMGLDVALTEELMEQEIDGDTLELLEVEHVQKMYPSLKTMGKVMKFMQCVKLTREDLKKQPAAMESNNAQPLSHRKLDTYREFDSPPKRAEAYEKGLILPDESLRPGGNLLEPIHKYCTLMSNDVEALAKETLAFAAACMNERVNGTIHFGVRGRSEQSPQQPAGEIVGMRVDKTQCNIAITDEIYNSFFPDQIHFALNCIREPMSIPVIQKEAAEGILSVIEVDVVPKSELVKEKAFFLKTKEENAPKLFRYIHGNVTSIGGKDVLDFVENKRSLCDLRKDCEKSFQKNTDKKHLHSKLHHLLTGGNKSQYADIFPVLFLSPCPDEMTNEYLLENFLCIKSLDPLVVFDFDPLNASQTQQTSLYSMMEQQLGQVHKTLTTDNFDENSEENKSSSNTYGICRLLDDITNSSLRTWIFCNGYGPLGKKQLEPAEWIRKRALGFKEAIRFYEKQIPKENARILILLLSHTCEALLPALEEVFAKFPEQWILVAESEKVVHDFMKQRCYVDKDVLEERSIIGMPWSHVNQSIMTIFGYNSGNGSRLPSSSGAPVLLKERKKNEWSDLDILSTNQCTDEANYLFEKGLDDKLRAKNRQTEEEYYRGAQVMWWNFFFKNHVLERDQMKELQEKVEEYLSDTKIPKDERVGVVNLFHQPGAGATTIARQVLWNLKSKYRCCVVKQITDQTSDHIANLRGFEEEQQSALPPVVLVDNEEIDKVCMLRSQLNKKAKRLARGGKAVHNVFCVLVVCSRISGTLSKRQKAPYQDKACVMLDHELKPEDIQWFEEKYKILEDRYKEKQGLNPKLLFSFNILKENFNPKYMQRVVNEFIEEIHDFKEKRLLRFVALINSFDLSFQSIPVSCFNAVMCPQQDTKKAKPKLEQKVFSRGEIHWASTLSQPLNVLLNRTSKPFCGKDIKAIKIVNNNLSKKILENLMECEKEQVSDVILDLLHGDIFKRSNESSVQNQLGKMVKDMLKTRITTKKRRDKFSPLILSIGEDEGYQQAADVLEVGFEMFDDPMLAQQIARVYIHMQNYDQAEKYARIAIGMEPGNFYLFDTLGQIYKQKLLGMWDTVVKSRTILGGDKAREIFDVAFTALDIFRDEQSLSDQDANLDYTNCGLMFQLHVISTLIDICRFLQPFKHNSSLLHKFLMDQSFVPDELNTFIGKENIQRLKMLHSESKSPLKRLEDEEIQLKDDPAYQDSTGSIRNAENCRKLNKVKIRLIAMFGETAEEVHKKLRPEELCEYRRNKVMAMGGTSFLSIRKLCEEKDAEKKFESMYDMMYENVCTKFCTDDDLLSLLNLTIGLISVAKSYAHTLSFHSAMNCALNLYEKTASLDPPNVEACLYLVMFHWPTDWRMQNGLPLCPSNKLKEVSEKWKQDFLTNHPAQKRKKPDQRKPTTMFFLGKGHAFDEIVFFSEFKHLRSTESMWDKEEVKSRLKKLYGTLHYGGKSVSVILPSTDDGDIRLDICTSLPITDKSMWNKTVCFVLGFAWSGLKAYDVNQDIMDDDDQDPLQPVSSAAKNTERSLSPRVPHDEMVAHENDFWEEYYTIHDELERIDTRLRHMSTNKTASNKLQQDKERCERRLHDLLEKRKNVLLSAD